MRSAHHKAPYPPTTTPHSSLDANTWSRYVPWLLCAIGIGVYANGLHGPFVFDDHGAIYENADIRRLWPPTWAHIGSGGEHAATNSRPVTSFTFALNYALDALDPFSYHLFNLGIHLGCALMAFGFLRKTLDLPALPNCFAVRADVLAFLIALLWLVHPIGSEGVNYVAQRSGQLMSFFYLAVFYCLCRIYNGGDHRWQWLAVASCALGMARKEAMVTAPFMAALYMRSFWVDSLRELRQKYGALLAGLALSWVELVLLLWNTPHGTAIGFSQRVDAWTYALNQCVAIIGYLQLSFWPRNLVLDYGFPKALTLADVWPYAIAVCLLLGSIIWLGRKRLPLLFAGAWLFVILAPTSSFVPIVNQVAAERRMYLPLLALVALTVLSAYQALLYIEKRTTLYWLHKPALALCLLVAVALAHRTVQRNQEYQNEIALWRSSIATVADNPRAHNNLANALKSAGQRREAIEHYYKALAIDANYYLAHEVHNNLANALKADGKTDEAIAHYQRALELRPSYAKGHSNLAVALLQQEQYEQALIHLRQAVASDPYFAAGHFNLAIVLEGSGQIQKATEHYLRAVHIQPDFAAAHNNLGLILGNEGDLKAAIYHFEQALRFHPDFAPAQQNLESALRAQQKELP